MSTRIMPLFGPHDIDARLHVDGEGDPHLYAASEGGEVADFLDANSFLAAVITEFGADRIREALGDASVEVESPDRYTVPRDYDEATVLWDSLGEDQPEFYSKGEVWMPEPTGPLPFSAFSVDGLDGDRAVHARRLYAAPKPKRPEWHDALVIRGRAVEDQRTDDEQLFMRDASGADLFICQSGCRHKPENLANVTVVVPAEA